MLPCTFLEYEKYRYLKITSLLIVLVVIAYLFDQPGTGAYGGTWLGYLLGVLSALVVIVLILYGVRKQLTPIRNERRDKLNSSPPLRIIANRRTRKAHWKRLLYGIRKQLTPRKYTGLQGLSPHPSPQQVIADRRIRKADWERHHGATLQGWTSAHVYLGAALIVLSTLHTGFYFGWNVHTLAYILMMIVIISGFYGTYAYLRFPLMLTDNLGNETFDKLLLKIENFDRLASIKSLQFSDDICAVVLKARQDTRIGGNFFQQLTGFQQNCPTAHALQQLKVMGEHLNKEQLKSFNDLYSIMVRKNEAVICARQDVMYKARLGFWLYFHAPVSIAFLTALIAHVAAIFFYW